MVFFSLTTLTFREFWLDAQISSGWHQKGEKLWNSIKKCVLYPRKVWEHNTIQVIPRLKPINRKRSWSYHESQMERKHITVPWASRITADIDEVEELGDATRELITRCCMLWGKQWEHLFKMGIIEMYWGYGGTSSLTAFSSTDLFPHSIPASRSSALPHHTPQGWWRPICLSSSPRPFIHISLWPVLSQVVSVAGKMFCLSLCLLKKVSERLTWGVCLALLLWLQGESTIPPPQHHHCKFRWQQGAGSETVHWCLSQTAAVRKVSWLPPVRTLEPGVKQTCMRRIQAERVAPQRSYGCGCSVWCGGFDPGSSKMCSGSGPVPTRPKPACVRVCQGCKGPQHSFLQPSACSFCSKRVAKVDTAHAGFFTCL